MIRKNYILYFSCFSIGVILAMIGAYMINFFNYDISSDSDDWAAFGSYFSGVASPLIGTATLIVVYATYTTQKVEFSKQIELSSEQLKLQEIEVERRFLTECLREHLDILKMSLAQSESAAQFQLNLFVTKNSNYDPVQLQAIQAEQKLILEQVRLCSEKIMEFSLAQFSSSTAVRSQFASVCGSLGISVHTSV